MRYSSRCTYSQQSIHRVCDARGRLGRRPRQRAPPARRELLQVVRVEQRRQRDGMESAGAARAQRLDAVEGVPKQPITLAEHRELLYRHWRLHAQQHCWTALKQAERLPALQANSTQVAWGALVRSWGHRICRHVSIQLPGDPLTSGWPRLQAGCYPDRQLQIVARCLHTDTLVSQSARCSAGAAISYGRDYMESSVSAGLPLRGAARAQATAGTSTMPP